MLTDRKPIAFRKLSHELLGLIAIAAAVSLVLFLLLSGIATVVAENYFFQHDIPMTELEWLTVDRHIFIISAVCSCLSFAVLFLLLLNDRIAYIKTITAGISQLQQAQQELELPLQGKNELTKLAGAINDMSRAQLALREKEQAMAREKEALIRSLSHDIRTPLTSILAYAEYLTAQENLAPEERAEYLQLIGKKAGQIRDLTAILLDGGRRNVEYYEDGRLLMEQLAAEFEEALEDRFQTVVDLSALAPFGGSFDVQELRRIFDNLCSNVEKYADVTRPVYLSVGIEAGHLQIRQSNAIAPVRTCGESFQIGLTSIRRIVQHYGGQVTVTEENGEFAVAITMAV